MTLTTAEDYDNPPVVYDAFGRADDSGSVVVDVLEGAYDPDGAVEDLEVVEVSGDPSARVVDGVQVRADRGEAPKVLPFQVRDADGATASRVGLHPAHGRRPALRPARVAHRARLRREHQRQGHRLHRRARRGQGAPRVRPPLLLRLAHLPAPSAPTGTTSSRSRPRRASADRARCSWRSRPPPTPAATRTPRRPTDGVTAILSIPVVVGDDVPSLECPSSVIPMSSGQRYDLDIATYCTVFTVDPRDAADLDFTAEWSQAVDGVERRRAPWARSCRSPPRTTPPRAARPC